MIQSSGATDERRMNAECCSRSTAVCGVLRDALWDPLGPRLVKGFMVNSRNLCERKNSDSLLQNPSFTPSDTKAQGGLHISERSGETSELPGGTIKLCKHNV